MEVWTPQDNLNIKKIEILLYLEILSHHLGVGHDKYEICLDL